MTLLAVVASGVFIYLLVGILTGNAPSFDRSTSPTRQVSERQLWLIQSGVRLTPLQFWATSAAVGLTAFGVMVGLTGLPMVALFPAMAVSFLPRFYFARKRAQVMGQVQAAWPDGLRDLQASISSGMSLSRAVETMAEKGPEPLREAFARYSLLMRTLGVVPALEVIKEELADPTSDRIIEILILAHERGGNVVPDILRDLIEATTRDQWTLEELATQSLEQRINARVVFILPWLVLVAMNIQDGPIRSFYSSTGGFVVITIGAILSTIGLVIVSNLAAEPDEMRVFGGGATVSEDLT